MATPTFSLNGSANIYQTKVGNDITNQIDTFVSTNNLMPTDIQYSKFTATVSYLTNPNPFYKVSIPTHREYFSDDIGILGNAAPQHLILQQNYNITTWTNNSPPFSVATSQINYTYSFRPDGFPAAGTMTRISNGSTKKTKILFVY